MRRGCEERPFLLPCLPVLSRPSHAPQPLSSPLLVPPRGHRPPLLPSSRPLLRRHHPLSQRLDAPIGRSRLVTLARAPVLAWDWRWLRRNWGPAGAVPPEGMHRARRKTRASNFYAVKLSCDFYLCLCKGQGAGSYASIGGRLLTRALAAHGLTDVQILVNPNLSRSFTRCGHLTHTRIDRIYAANYYSAWAWSMDGAWRWRWQLSHIDLRLFTGTAVSDYHPVVATFSTATPQRASLIEARIKYKYPEPEILEEPEVIKMIIINHILTSYGNGNTRNRENPEQAKAAKWKNGRKQNTKRPSYS
eukprot:scaffold187758_cov32-Tisochrysis_lutea.AAC.1